MKIIEGRKNSVNNTGLVPVRGVNLKQLISQSKCYIYSESYTMPLLHQTFSYFATIFSTEEHPCCIIAWTEAGQRIPLLSS